MSNTILIVDESMLSIEILENALVKRNKTDIIHNALDNKSALEKIKRYPIELIIIDSVSAQKNEFELLRELSKTPQIKIILMSNLAPVMNEYIQSLANVYALNINSIIKKPLASTDVALEVTHVLEMETVVSTSNEIEQYDISLLYQPQFQLNPKKVTGFEILSRWAEPDDKTLSKHAFLPLISKRQLNMKKKFNLTVIKNFIEDYDKYLYELPLDLTFSLNIDKSLLNDTDLLASLKKMYHNNINHSLVIEISGNDIDQPVDDEFLNNIISLKSEGFKISIDKFGFAPVNYPYIKMLPVDEIKIERTITNDYCQHKINQNELNQAIDVIEEMKAEVVFEGIETQQMADMIANNGNHKQQGFFHCVPIPPIMIKQII